MIDSRSVIGGIRRRRKCKGPFQHRFTTFERMIEPVHARPMLTTRELSDIGKMIDRAIRRVLDDPIFPGSINDR